MAAEDSSDPETLPRAYAAWRCRLLAGALIATAVGAWAHGLSGEVRIGEETPLGIVIAVAALAICFFGPVLAGTCLALAAIWKWRQLGTSSRLVRTAWFLWVLGPLPVLLLPLAHLFDLNATDALETSVGQARHLLIITAPAVFALLPGTLRAALVIERFLPESRAPGQVAMLAAPACTVVYLLPLGIMAQLAFQPGLYLGLLLLAISPLVPLLAVRKLLRRDHTPDAAVRLVRKIVVVQGALGMAGLALIAIFVVEHPWLQTILGQISRTWAVGLLAKVLASKWLTTVVVADMLISMMLQGRLSAQSLADTTEREILAKKLDALGHSLRGKDRV